MKQIIVVIALAGLAGCGANGAPFTPTGNSGLSVGPNGVTPTTTIGATNGPVTISIGS